MDDFWLDGPHGRYAPKEYNPEIGKNCYFFKMGATGPAARPLRIVVTNRKYRNFESLMDEVSEKVPGMLFGVQKIFVAGTKRQITSMEELEDGGQYTCEAKTTGGEKWATPRKPSAGLKRLGQQNAPPKRITIMRANDQNDRQTLLLNRKTTQSFEQILNDVGQLFPGMYSRKLYTLDGAPITSLNALFNGPDVLTVGRLEADRGGGRHSAGGKPQQAARKLGVKTRTDYRSRGRWKIWITTGEMPASGTTSRVFFSAYGKSGVAGPLALGLGDGTAFQTGNIDEFDVNLGSLGPLYKVRLSHDNSGQSPNWFVEEVRMRDMDTGEEFTFPFRRWLSRTEDDLDVHREYPVPRRSQPPLPLGVYTVDVYTGGVPNAGTDANIYCTLYGENGDAGNRQLFNGRSKNFVKGHMARFQVEAVSLGNLTHLQIGHDGRGPGRGWFLDKIVVKEQFGQFREWIFGCNRWLDEGQDDHKIIRDLYPGGSELMVAENVVNLWDFERWKYDLRNQLIFYSAATSRAICFRPGNNLDSLGEENDRKSNKSVFEVVHVRHDYRAFANCAQRGACIALKNGIPIVQSGANNSGNLTNSICEFKPSVVNADRRTNFESGKTAGHQWCITPSGQPADCRSVTGNGPLKEFYVYCKGMFRDGNILSLVAANNLSLALDKDGKKAVATNVKNKLGQFRVVKVAEGGLRMFESAVFQNQFLQMKNGSCSCQGIGDRFSQFRVHRVREKAYVLIQSVAYPGSYLALTSNGKAQQVTDPGSASIIFYPEVIRFGTPKPARPAPMPLAPRAPSQPPPEPIPAQPKRHPVYVPPSPSPSPELEPPDIPTPQPMLPRHPQPENKTRFNEGDWLVWISTHETAVNGNVGLAVYGANGTSGTIMLGGPSRNMFKKGTKDQFLINLKQLGELYKIRLEFYPISFSTSASWKIADAQLHDMTTNELLRFSFNRFVSVTEDDGDLMRELPAIRPGAPILTIYNYYVEVETGYVDGAQTTANIYLQIFGQRGDTGRRLLHRSTGNNIKWQPGQTDKFYLDAVDLSTLTKCLVAVDTREPGAGWFLAKIVIREWENAQMEYTFACNRWFDVGRDDGQTERFIYPSSPAPGPRKQQQPYIPQPMMPQQPQYPQQGQPIIIFAQPPAPFPYLPPSYPPYPYPQQQAPPPAPAPAAPPKSNDPPEALPQPGEWNVWVTTGQAALKGKAELWVYGSGRTGKVGPLALGSGTSGNFKVSTTDNFKVVVNPSLGNIYKIRIGHLDTVVGDEWFVEKVLMKNLETEQTLTFWIRRWMARNQDDFDVVRESPAIRPNQDPLEVLKYLVDVKLGNQRGIKPDNKVHIELRGNRGDTGLRQLYHSTTNKNKFLAGQRDTFVVEAVDLEDLTEILIGHKSDVVGQGFYIENVTVTLENDPRRIWFFPCDKWFDKGEGDQKIERVLPAGQRAATPPPPTDGEWIITTKTGPEPLMATNDSVVLWAYGDRGRIGPLKLSNKNHNKYFKTGATDEFIVNMPTPALGKMYKIRIGRLEDVDDNWFCDWVKAKNKGGDYVLTFDCRRWMSRTNDDLDVWRELPAVWPGKQPLPIYRYKLEVYTGRKPGGDTDAKVYAELRGKRGDSGQRVLYKAINNTAKKFKMGQCDEFEIEAVDLDDLQELLVGHDCKDKGGGWFLDRIAVFLSSDQTKGAPLAWYFACNKWLDKGEDDGAIERILRPGPPPAREGDWNVWTTTGPEGSMQTSDTVVLWAYGYGDKGKAGPIQLGSGRTGNFKSGQTDEFKVFIDPKLGTLYKVRIGRLEQSEDPWFLDKVKMKDLYNSLVLNFGCKRWLSRTEDDLDVWRELPVVQPGKAPLDVFIYKVEVYTGSEPGSDTEAKVYMEIRGQRGDTGIRKLYRSKNHPSEPFQLSQMDLFEIEAVDLSELTEIMIGHNSEDRGAGWFLEKVIIRLEKPTPRAWSFPCKKWFDRGQGDGRIERVVKVGEAPPPKKPEPKEEPKEKPKQEEPKELGDWEVQITTGKTEPACGNQANKIELWAYGDDDVVGPLTLASGKDGKYFKPGAVDTFQVKLGGQKPGKMYKIRFGHEEDDSETSTWFVEKVKIKDNSTKEETLYKCGRWLSRTHEDKDVWRELPTPGPSQLPILIYEISIATGKLPGSDTDAKCFIQLFGKKGDSGKRILYHSTNNKNKFREGQTDVFKLEAVDLDDLQKIYIGHNDTATGAGWYIERVIITTKTKNGELQWYFPGQKWFDSGQDDGKTERFLYPGDPPGESKGEYKVIIKTAADSGKVPQGKKITLAIYGDQSQTNDNELQCKRIDPYQPNAEDEAVVKAIGLGKIFKIRVGHADKFAPFDWHLDWIKLVDVGTKEEFLFNFDKWLSLEKAPDNHLDREAAVADKDKKNKPTKPTLIYYVGVYIGDHWFAESDAPLYVKITGQQGDTGKRYLFYTAAKKKAVIQRGKMLAFPVEAIDLKDLKNLIIGCDAKGHGQGTYIDIIRVSTSNDANNSLVFPCGRWLDPWEDDGLCERMLRYVDKIPANEQLSRTDTKAPKVPSKWKVKTKSGPDTVANYNTEVYLTMYGTRGKSKRQKLANGSRPGENFAANSTAEFEYSSGDIGHLKKIALDTYNTDGEVEPLNLDWVKLSDATGATTFQYLFYMDRWLGPDAEDGSLCREVAVAPLTGSGGTGAASAASTKSTSKSPSAIPSTPIVLPYLVIIETGGASKATGGLPNGSAKLEIVGSEGDTGERLLLRSHSQTGAGPSFGKPGTTDVFFFPAVDLGTISHVNVALVEGAKGPWQIKKIRIRRTEHDCFETVFSAIKMVGTGSPTRFENPEAEMSGGMLQFERRYQPSPAPPSGNCKVTMAAQAPSGRPKSLTLIAFSSTGKQSDPIDVLKLAGNLAKLAPFQVAFGAIGPIFKVRFQVQNDTAFSWKIDQIMLSDTKTKEDLLCVPSRELSCSEATGGTGVLDVGCIRPDLAPLAEISYELAVFTGDKERAEPDAQCYTQIIGSWGDSGRIFFTKSDQPKMFKRAQRDICDIQLTSVGTIKTVGIGHISFGRGLGWFINEVQIRDTSDKTKPVLCFPAFRWLDTGTGDRKVYVDLLPVWDQPHVLENPPEKFSGSFDCRLITASDPGSARPITIMLVAASNPANTAKQQLTLNPSEAATTQGQSFQIADKRLTDLLKMRVEDPGSDKWIVRELFATDRDTGEELHFNFSHLLGKTNDGCREHPAVRFKHPTPPLVDYVVKLFGVDDEAKPLPIGARITLEGAKGESGPRKVAAKKLPKEGHELTVEAVTLGGLISIAVDKDANTSLIKRATVKEGRFGATEFIFHWESVPGTADKALKYSLTYEGVGLSADTAAPKSVASDTASAKKGATPLAMAMDPKQADTVKDQLREALKKNGLDANVS